MAGPEQDTFARSSSIAEGLVAILILFSSLRRWRGVPQLARRFEIVSVRTGYFCPQFFNSGGPDMERNTMNNERKFYRL